MAELSGAGAAPAAEQGGEKKERRPLTSVKAIGVCHDRNARFRRTMEDAHVVVDNFGDVATQGYFGVYDGHGGRGAVEFVRDHLHENFLKELEKSPDEVIESMKRAYKITDDQIGENKIEYSGTTTVSAFIRQEKDGSRRLYTANVGDARAVLCRGGGLEPERLTYDHKGSDEGEVKRIQEAGGFVVMNRVNGILAVTRSLGDRAMKEYVVGDPYTRVIDLLPDDTHLILACDGVWDVISDRESCEVIQKYPTVQEAAKQLLISSLRKGSTDNISVMVIAL